MANVTLAHENLFQQLVARVDSVAVKDVLSHLFTVIKDTAAPAVEAMVPEAAPVVAAVEAAVPITEKSIEELQKLIADAQAALQARQTPAAG